LSDCSANQREPDKKKVNQRLAFGYLIYQKLRAQFTYSHIFSLQFGAKYKRKCWKRDKSTSRSPDFVRRFNELCGGNRDIVGALGASLVLLLSDQLEF
jgi:hypothetical protein